jgi:hypothetical protein
VTATYVNNVWAVGYDAPTGCETGACGALIEHWNSVNSAWRVIPNNAPTTFADTLWSISGVSRTDIWAVGAADEELTLILHWNGTSWS